MSDWLVGDRIGDWRRAIGELILLHQRIRDLDDHAIWMNELPRVAAKPEQIVQVERQMGCELDVRFKAFLLCADGWRAFYQWVDLFGTEDFLSEPIRVAELRLAELDRGGVLALAGFGVADLLPIAMTRPGQGVTVPDLFAQVRGGRKSGGEVLWLSDEEVDRFRDFDSFYLAMLDYNREEIEDLVIGGKQQA
jgi:hypothetical protein